MLGLPHGDEVRTALLRSHSVPEVMDKAEAYFSRLRAYEAGDTAAFR